MKRSVTTVLCALVLMIGAAALYAENRSQLSIDPSEMRDGETKTFTDDGRSITVKREGNATTIRIDGADDTENLTITRQGNRIRIGHFGDSENPIVIGPRGSRSIIIDGMPLGDFTHRFRNFPDRKMSTFFVCPKDKTTLRVPDAKEEATFKCPVDGTEMDRKKGRGFTFFLDELESHSL